MVASAATQVATVPDRSLAKKPFMTRLGRRSGAGLGG
jgi:hypothetical protein